MSATPPNSVCPHCGSTVNEIAELSAQVQSLRQAVQELTEQAHTDTLTGLSNYRHFCETLDYEMERTQRTGQPTSLVMVDLDHFKRLNDTYGHEAGNVALQQTARLLKQCIRKLDIACRYGGEEFAIILPSSDLLTGSQVAERLRREIANNPLHWEGEVIPITASLGVDQFQRGSTETVSQFVQRVDALLYQAKQNGRNQVSTAQRQDLHTDNSVSSAEKEALFELFSSKPDAGSPPKKK